MTSEVPECHESFWDNGRLQMRWFYLNSRLHRTDGPAWEHWNRDGRLVSRMFWVNSKRHNTDGPADETWNNQGGVIYRAFYVNGEKLSEEDFLAWQERHQRQRGFAALVFALENKFPADAPEREFLRHILPNWAGLSSKDVH